MPTLVAPSDLKARVGETVGTSEWFEVSQERIDTFAKATDDYQFIHVDAEKAKLTPFGGTIAHGFLTVSMLSPMMETALEKPDVKMSVNYGFNKLRFLAPVKSGKRIRGRFKLVDVTERQPGVLQSTVEVTVEIDGEDKPALIAEWVTLADV